MRPIVIDPHYNGPTGIGHGGTAAGHFATLVEPDAATVRLRTAIPLATELTAHAHGDDGENYGTVMVYDGGTVVAEVRDLARPLAVDPFDLPDTDTFAAAETGWLATRDGEHMAPSCYACGNDRKAGGLGLRPGPIDGGDVHGCTWRPEGEGPIPSWLVWAALDCPTGAPAFNAVGRDQAVVTGELSVQILRPVIAGRTHRILSRQVAHNGRRHHTEAALFDAAGRRLAVATATWFAVPLPAVLSAAA